MKQCPFCAEEIQDAAIVCKHCGRDLVATAPKSPGPRPIPQRTGCFAVVGVILVILVGLSALGILVGISARRTPPTPPRASRASRTLNVSVAWNAFVLRITNQGEPAGGELIVYINGTPGSTFEADTRMPARGQSVVLPLRGFVTIAGDRFDPITKAVTIAWVGGGGADYASFSK